MYNKISFIQVSKDKQKDFYYMFDNFGHFTNLLNFIKDYTIPDLFVDDISNPKYAILIHKPAYFIVGDPNEIDTSSILSLIPKYGWIVPSSISWDSYIEEFFKGSFERHHRVQFDSSSLNQKHLKSMLWELPSELRIEQITKKHIEDIEGIVNQDLIQKFFKDDSFLEHGIGIALMIGDSIIGYAASDNPFKGDNLELMFRIGYDSTPEYRLKGFGTLLCVHFILLCLSKGIHPAWDAHTDISAHIALKLGYTFKKEWNMYNIK